MKELTRIAQNYYTDKGLTWENSHGYTEFYDEYFKKYKIEKRKVYILEIGIQYGYDLLMINDYFEGNCEIYGFDIDLSQVKIEVPDNIHLFELDASNKEMLNNFYNKYSDGIASILKLPKFDIIIDDGSHKSEEIFKSFFFFESKLQNDGIYIIEDLHGYESVEFLFLLLFENSPNKTINIDKFNSIISNFSCFKIIKIFNNLCKEKPSICAILEK